MPASKSQKEAILNSKKSKIMTAVNNSIVQLRKMGIEADVVVNDNDPDTAFIVIPIEDIRKLIERKCRKAVEKGTKGVEITTYREEDLLVIRVRK